MKIGRNDLCPCGSGKKYKKCCLNKDKAQSRNSKSSGDENIHNLDENGKIKHNPSFQKMKQSIEGAKAVKAFTDLGFLEGFRGLGLDVEGISENLSKMVGMEEEFELLANINDRFNEHFLERGWIAHESINFEIMKNAVELADEGKFEEAEEFLINGYEENLELSVQMIKWMEEIKPRTELLQLAYEDYLAERYHSCILMLFTIIDGLVADTKEIDGNKCFFAEGEEIYAWDSIAAHKTGLTELRKLLYQNRGKTTTDEIDVPYRNGILHGRDLNYANKKVTVKLWATLFALRDGIIAIKRKGKEPKEESDKIDFMKTMELVQENETRKKLLEEWKPREIKVNVDFPETGNSSDYEDETPEKTLVEFFDDWKNNKWGWMVNKLNYRILEGDTLGKRVFELKEGIFKNKKLKVFSIIDIADDSSLITDIKVNLTIQREEDEISKDISFRMLYERDDGEMELRGMKNGSWKIYTGVWDIEAL